MIRPWLEGMLYAPQLMPKHLQERWGRDYCPPELIKEEDVEPERYEPQTQRKLYNRIQQLEGRLLHMENEEIKRRAFLAEKAKQKKDNTNIILLDKDLNIECNLTDTT